MKNARHTKHGIGPWQRTAFPAALALAAVAVMSTPTPAAPTTASNPVQTLAGRYSTHFLNGLVDGSHYWSDNVAEIVPVAPDAAYVRVSLQFYNGHSCGIYGVAKAEGDRLVYHDPSPPEMDDQSCVLTLSRSGDNLSIDDNHGTCKDYCGERGSLTDDTLPFKSRRTIRYMERLKTSERYKSALKQWNDLATH